MRHVAASVGMKAPSLYQYFATKNDLYDAMLHSGYELLGAVDIASASEVMPAWAMALVPAVSLPDASWNGSAATGGPTERPSSRTGLRRRRKRRPCAD